MNRWSKVFLLTIVDKIYYVISSKMILARLADIGMLVRWFLFTWPDDHFIRLTLLFAKQLKTLLYWLSFTIIFTIVKIAEDQNESFFALIENLSFRFAQSILTLISCDAWRYLQYKFIHTYAYTRTHDLNHRNVQITTIYCDQHSWYQISTSGEKQRSK